MMRNISRQVAEVGEMPMTDFAAGEILSVGGTENDFLSARPLSDCVTGARDGVGYCVNFCVGNQDGDIW